MIRPTRFLLAASLLAASAAPAFATWPNSSYVNLPVSTAPFVQSSPLSVGDGDGGIIITWQDSRNGTHYDIYAQHVLASGAVDPSWPIDGRALCTAPNNQTYATISADGAGGAIVSWSDSRSVATPHIFAQHVLASGAVDPAWPLDGRPLCTATGSQYSPMIVADGTGGAIVTWYDSRSGTNDIYAQRVLSSGTVDPAWPANGRALCAAAGNQSVPMMVADGVGGAIVTWNDYRGGATSDIYAQHVLASGVVDPAWPLDGRALCSAVNNQIGPTIAGDGAGGAIVVWDDMRSGVDDIYAQHVLASGVADPMWPADGRPLCTATSFQVAPMIVSDGGGGAIATWYDSRNGSNNDIYAQHVLASGALDPSWPLDGRALCTAVGNQFLPAIIGDGAGGAIVSWYDYRLGAGADVYAQHVLASGSIDPVWPLDGRAVSTATNDQAATAIVGDGTGGAIIVWNDYRNGTADIYAQRVARFGYLGTPEAELASVKDVQGDNGGNVKVSWRASYFESDPYGYYTTYNVFRSVPAALAAPSLARDARLHAASDAVLQPGDLVALPFGATTVFWELMATFSGSNVPGYSYVARTAGDSTAAGNPRTLFMVQTRTNYGWWNSRPDSGYSVDNLPPVTPAPFAGTWSAGTTLLTWSANADADLAGYRLYRGTTSGFVPGPANVVANTTATTLADAAAHPYVYKLTAVDTHGNESAPAVLVPGGTAGVGDDAGQRALALAPASPNPASRGTLLRFTLPSAGDVSLGVYDAAGRLVRALAGGATPAGEHAMAWDLRDANGRNVGAGLYFARLDMAGATLVRRIAVTP